VSYLEHLATIPTVGDALEALNNLCDDLADTLKQIADISAELASKEHIAINNIREARSLSIKNRTMLMNDTDDQRHRRPCIAGP
jgi:hypothetical protein